MLSKLAHLRATIGENNALPNTRLWIFEIEKMLKNGFAGKENQHSPIKACGKAKILSACQP